MGAAAKFKTKQHIPVTQLKRIIGAAVSQDGVVEVNHATNSKGGYFTFKYKDGEFVKNLPVHIWFYIDEEEEFKTFLSLHPQYGTIIKQIAEYVGGWFIENDNINDVGVYITPLEHTDTGLATTNSQQLYDLVASAIGFKDVDKVVALIRENKDKLIEFNFGVDN
jgi:hypothetical protein